MSTPPNNPKESFTRQAIDAWVLAAQEQCAKLHLQTSGLWQSSERQEAFAHMSELLLEALEEMRMISAALREDSQALRSHAAGLRERSQHLYDRLGRAAVPAPPCPPPTPEEVQQAESRLLAMFKGSHNAGES
jgi:signal transduction histidine kinase